MNIFRIVARAARALLLAVCMVPALLLSACAAPGEELLTLHTDKGSFTFHVEIAETDQSRAKGLMYRSSLASDAGMLFDFHHEELQTFWMQNTWIPLDMIFIGEDGTVRTIHENARPLDTTVIPSGVPVRFVLELAGGHAAEIGLKVGDKVDEQRVGTPMDQ